MAAPAVPPEQVLSDGFAIKVHYALHFHNRIRYVGLGIPPPPPPDTRTVVVNEVYRIASALLTASGIPTATLRNDMLVVHPTLGPDERAQFQPVFTAVACLGKYMSPPRTDQIPYPDEFMSYLHNIANDMLFPNKVITWEGICMLISFTGLVAGESFFFGMPGNRHVTVLNWCLHYISRPAQQRRMYPGIQNWIAQRTWNAICDHVVALSARPLPIWPPGPAPWEEICYCNLVRKDRSADSRFPFMSCHMCNTLWCRIEGCRETFNSITQLQTHQKHYHKYPPLNQKLCECRLRIRPRNDFHSTFQNCEYCGRFVCLITECRQTYLTRARLNRHQLTAHPDPYTCRQCRQTSKPRDGQVDRGFCNRCGNNFWCLRGYCNKELRTQAGINRHILYECLF